MSDKFLRQQALSTIQAFLDDEIIQFQDLERFRVVDIDICEPEYMRCEMERWYINLGIEQLTKQPFSLSLPYFTKDEIKNAQDKGDIILCVPKGVGRADLGRLFHMDSWAFTNGFVSVTTEQEDFWFQTEKSLTPGYMDKTAVELKKIFDQERKLGMSLERYMVFLARMRTVYKQIPDQQYKTWLLNGKYENKAQLIAGFDAELELSVHAWMRNFHSPMVGARSITIPDHH